MKRHLIENVPGYFEAHVNDCFQNALSSLLMYNNLDPDLILADYLSFLYNSEKGLVGINYPFKYNTTVEFTEEELNTSLETAYFPLPVCFHAASNRDEKTELKERITIHMYLEKDKDAAYQRIKELIDHNIPAVVAVDLYYIRYHRAYGKEHGLHYIVITGYDEEEGWYALFDRYKLSSSDFEGRLPIQEIMKARNSENPLKNAVVGEYSRPIQNVWCELGVPEGFGITKENIRAVLEESCKRMEGRTHILGNECGFPALKRLIRDLTSKRENGLTDPEFSYFKTYFNETFKTIARSRKRFRVFVKKIGNLYPETALEEISFNLEESSKHWDICANLSLKMGITRSLSLLGDMIRHLTEIKEMEGQAINRIMKMICL